MNFINDEQLIFLCYFEFTLTNFGYFSDNSYICKAN